MIIAPLEVAVVSEGGMVFSRRWSGVDVSVNCSSGVADIAFKADDEDANKESALLRRMPFLMAHQAATYLIQKGDPNYEIRRSQSISLVSQLSCGVRALDLRLVATEGSSPTQARLWSGDMDPDDEPDPANCTHCWVSTETLETVVRELKGCKFTNKTAVNINHPALD